MSDQTAIIIVGVLAFIFACLWIFNGRQKRRFDEERRKRKRDLDDIKAKARNKE